MATRRKKTVKHVTEEQSLEILEPFFNKEKFIKCTNHMPFPHAKFGPGVYRFTVNIMSLDLLINIMEHDQVENVYFTATAAPPGAAIDGISFLYKVYVKYSPIS